MGAFLLVVAAFFERKKPSEPSQDSAQEMRAVLNRSIPDFNECLNELKGDRWSTRLKESLPSCFQKFQSPWIVDLELVFRGKKLQIQDLKNVEIFTSDPDSSRHCIEGLIAGEFSGIDRVFGSRRLSELAQYRIEKQSQNSSIKVTLKSTCIETQEELSFPWPHSRDESQIRDRPFLVGSSVEKDQITSDLKGCDPYLSHEARARSLLIKFVMARNSLGQASYLWENQEDASSKSSEGYIRCVSEVLSRRDSQAVLAMQAKLVVTTGDGKDVEIKSEQEISVDRETWWYFRKASKGPQFYMFKDSGI